MRLSISEEKINTEAAALEICRNQIIIDLEKSLRIREKPKNLHVLQTELQKDLLKDRYPTIRAMIVSNMDAAEQSQIPDYKVEMYIRNFIIDPLMDDNYQRLLNTLKKVITEQFIDKFPITTMVLDTTVIDRLNLNNQGKRPLDTLYTTVNSFLPVLDLTDNFASLVRAMERDLNFFIDMANSSATNQDFMRRVTSDSNHLVRILEYNCWVLLDLSCRILDTTAANYRLDLLLTRDDLAKLQSDFKDFCRERIIKDNRYLGKMSPKSLYATINGYCKDAWRRIKSKISNDLAFREKNKVIMPYTERSLFKNSFYKHFRDDVEMTLASKLKVVPREDVFLYSNYMNVSQNIDSMIDHCFNQMVIGMKEATDKPERQVQDMMEQMYNPETWFKFKYFQINSKFNVDEILSVTNRKWIVIGALVSTPKTLFADEYSEHLNHIARIGTYLEVMHDTEVKQLFSILATLQSRKANKDYIEMQKKRCEQVFSGNQSLRLPEIIYLIVGLYFLVTDSYKDIDEMKRAFEDVDLIRFAPPSYKKRRLLFQIIRFLKNGHFYLLNYSIVHIIEMNLARQRLAHNRYIQKMILKKDIRDTYIMDYNELIKVYKEMPISDFAKLIQGSHHGFQDPHLARREALFRSNFIADTKFVEQNIVMSKDNVPMLTVDKCMTLERVSSHSSGHNDSGVIQSQVYQPEWMDTDENVIVYKTSQMSQFLMKSNKGNEETLKFHGKLQYLQENIRTYEFISLQREKSGHSRYPIMVLSGFMSENSDKFDDWRQMVDLYPYTEIITINWEALTPTRIFSDYMTSLRKVSVGSIASMLAGQLHNIISSKDEPENLNQTESQERMETNPFERANNQEDDSNAGVLKEKAEEPDSNPGIFGLFKKAKMKDIFNVDNLTLVYRCNEGCSQSDQSVFQSC